MGSSVKKSLRFANKLNPHTWVLGEKASASMDFGGQAFGAYDDNYKPADIEAPASPVVDDQAYAQRDRIRRLARKAQGQSSTIRAGTAQPYTGQPARLLGG